MKFIHDIQQTCTLHRNGSERRSMFISIRYKVSCVVQCRYPTWQVQNKKESWFAEIFHYYVQLQLLLERNLISYNFCSYLQYHFAISCYKHAPRAAAKSRAHGQGPRNRIPCQSSFVVGLGEGRATRKLDVIWWPNLYNTVALGK